MEEVCDEPGVEEVEDGWREGGREGGKEGRREREIDKYM